MNGRRKEIKDILGAIAIGNTDSEDLKKLLKKAPPQTDSEIEEELEKSEKPFSLKTFNKSYPYLEIYRDIELDKNNRPIYSFRFVSKCFDPSKKDIYLGSFGAEEVLEVLKDREISKKNKTPPDKIEIPCL